MSVPAENLAGLAALAEPLRRRMYLFVCAEADAVSRDGAAEQFGVSRSVAAFHLDKLAEAGLVEVEFRRPEGRTGPGAGRPAKLYRRASQEVAFSMPPRGYDMAGHVLAEAIAAAGRDQVPVDEALRASARGMGRTLGERGRRELETGAEGSGGQGDEEATAVAVMTACGYEPQVDGEGVTLRNCPFHALAEHHRDLVCGMNLDLITGVLEGIGRTVTEAGLGKRRGLRPRLEPAPGQCCVRLLRTGAASARAGGAE